MPSFSRHVFVCINERAPDHPRGSCKAKGGDEVRDALKKELKKRGLDDRIRANNAGCLDQCEQGITVVVYPEQVWYGHVTLADIPELVERHLEKGELVERLLLPEQPHLCGATQVAPLPATPAIPRPPKPEKVARPEKAASPDTAQSPDSTATRESPEPSEKAG